MQKQKCSLQLYTNFLIANQNRYSGVELSKVAPFEDISHDSVSRFLASSNFTPSQLWNQVKGFVDKTTGYLICDDTLLDKRYSKANELAKKHYSGKEHKVMNGIPLVNLLWTQGDEFIPIDYRVYQKENDDKTKNDHFHDMLQRAKQRGLTPQYVLMDAWYSSINNLKFITKRLKWNFICNLKSNRQVSMSQGTYCSLADLDLAEKHVRKVWLKEYGFIVVCKIVHTNGDITYVASSDLTLTDYDTFTDHFHQRWKIEEFHRGIKQTTGIEKCYSTLATSQLTHIFASFLAFVKLEIRRIKERISWYEQKASLARFSVTHYLLINA